MFDNNSFIDSCNFDLNLLDNDNLSIKSTGDDLNFNKNHSLNNYQDFIPYSPFEYFVFKDYNNFNNELNEKKNDINKTNIQRKDYILKKFKVKSSEYLIKKLNENDEKIKFYKLNFKYFTQNINYNQNFDWFKYKVKEIIILNHKKNNKAIIKLESKIKKSKIKNSKKLNEINELLNITYYDYLKYYYENQFDNDFKENPKYYEALKNYNYIKTMHIIGNNRKK